MSAYRCPSCHRVTVDVESMRRTEYRPATETPLRVELRLCWPCERARERALWRAFDESPERVVRP